MRNDRERLLDILEAAEQIEKYAKRGRQVFESDELIQIWIVYRLQIIGEAANGISDQLKALSSEIPWSQIIGMRNILVHAYFNVDLEATWSAVERDLPDLVPKIKALLAHASD